MPHRPQTHTAVSAPGKVLLTGGYLVLDRAYTGTVFALDARIHVIVQQLSRSGIGVSGNVDGEQTKQDAGNTGNNEQGGGQSDHKEAENDEDCRIVVKSPQFIDAVWEYGIERIDEDGGVKVAQIGDTPRNPFVETALNYSLTYISYVAASKHFGSLSITILADNDYYSETEASKGPAASSRGHFANFGVTLKDAHKTGLGSSAALVTALVSAVVIHRTMHADDLDVAREKLHNLAQAAHCAAQGKVGSGFDVAAAVYGTCLYRRFSPSVLSKLGEVGSPQFEERLFTTVEDLDPEHPWDAECIDFGTKLPRGMQMVLCDVDCGSETPSMVKKVLEWRENNRKETDNMWAELQCNNEKLRQELKRLAQPPAPVQDYGQVRALISMSRAYIRMMTRKSGVPIEPRVQKELLDALSEVDGVIGGLVPGAGGYDAIAVLVRDDAQFVENVRKFLEGWKSTVEDDFGGKIERVRLLGVRHGSEGVRNEAPRQYAEWIQ